MLENTKAEGGMATSALLHKVKVKEEAKECCGYQQPSATPATSPSTTTSTEIATASTASTVSNSSVVVSSVAVTASTTGASSLAVSLHQSSAIVCHPSATTSTVLVNADPFPVDLDLKTKAKANIGTREKSLREDVQPEAHSPSQKISKQSNGARPEHGKASSDSDSPLQSLKPESEDTSGSGGSSTSVNGNCRTEEQNDVSNSATGNRCIAGLFTGHGELKSVLGTVVKFATGISSDTGDTVLALVLALLSGSMTAEEFHSALQEATNYSLKGFVLPHLKQQLPSLQRDLSNAARASNQSCAQYLRSNEAAVLEAVGLASDQVEVFGEHTGNGTGSGNTGANHYGIRSSSNPGVGTIQHTNNATGGLHHYSGSSQAPKRRASDTPYYENGLLEDVPVYGKRLSNPWNHHHLQQQQQPPTDSSSPYCWYHPLHSSSGSIQSHGRHSHSHGHGHGPSPIPTGSVQMTQMNAFTSSHQHLNQQQHHLQTQNGSLDDEWKNIHMMLNCILGMVEKTKKALAILQTRGCYGPAAVLSASVPAQNGAAGNNPSSTNGSHVESSTGDREGSLKRLSGEIVAQTIRAIEDKVAEVKRKDEEAVKRAVMAEVQRAVRVAVAESRASERLRVHRVLDVPMSHRNHGAIRQGPYLRVHGNPGPVDANARTVATPTTVSNSIPSISEDEKDTHMQTVSGSNCWNCGRPALETCGGCGVARYCGSFCQHRDWEAGGHHATCNNPPPREPRRSASRSPPRIATVNEANASAASISVSAASKGK